MVRVFNKYLRGIFSTALCLWLAAGMVAESPHAAYADDPPAATAPAAAAPAPNTPADGTCATAAPASNAAANNTCIDAATYTNNCTPTTTIGQTIITAIFNTIDAIMTSIAYNFYTNIVGNSNFQAAVSGMTVLYLAVYGAMILFNLAPFNGREVINRLIKIGIVYSLLGTSGGWTFFDTYIGNLFLGGMNELITQFSAAGVGGTSVQAAINAAAIMNAGGTSVADCTQSGALLQCSAMSMLFQPIGSVFAAKFLTALISLASTCTYGPILGGLMLFGLVEFLFMLVGALITYVKAVIGLCFLFGIAPIFIACILFDRTRQIFLGWVNQVASFALTPVMLFAFLAFYVQLINSTINFMLYTAGTSPNYCWAKWFSFGGLDIFSWRPQPANGQVQTGDCGPNTLPSIPVIDILYFVLLCFLGKSFSEYVEQLARDLTNGIGPGVTHLQGPTSMVMNALKGGGGSTPAQPGAQAAATTARMRGGKGGASR